MRSNLFKRAKACTCPGEECDCQEVMGRQAAKEAYETVGKLATYFDGVDASFSHLRWASEASRDLKAFLARNTDIVTASVTNTILSVRDMHTRLASNDFDYNALVDETSPNDMFDAPDPIFDTIQDDKDVTKELGNEEPMVAPTPVDKTAASSLLGGGGSSSGGSGGSGPWADLPTESLTKIVKALSGDLEDKAVQSIVAEVSGILAERTPEPEEPVEDAKVAKAHPGLRLAAGEPLTPGLDVHTDQGNLDGDSIDDRLKGDPDPKMANNGSPVDAIVENMEVLEGDKSVTANNGDPVNSIVEGLEVLEGDKSVTANKKSPRLLGLRIASIE